MAITFCSSESQFEEAAVHQFEMVARVSSPSWAHIRARGIDTKMFVVESMWDQRDLVRKEKRHFRRSHLLRLLPTTEDERGKIEKLGETCPTEMSNVGMMSISPSGKYVAILKNDHIDGNEKKQYLEIWERNCLLHCVKLSGSKKHGIVFDDPTFGVLEWSPTEDRLLFIAERHRPKAISYFDKGDESCESGDGVRGTEHLYYEEWGELLTKHHCPLPVIFCLDTQECQAIDCIPNNISVGQAIWCSNGDGLVFIGWDNEPQRLGLIYCHNRKSAVYYWRFSESKLDRLSAANVSVLSPRLSPNRTKLVWLENKVGGPHRSCSKLMLLEVDTRDISCLVGSIHTPNGDGFPGLYVDTLPTRCWTQDGSKVVFSSVWTSMKEIVCVDVMLGTVSKISPDGMTGCWSVLDVFDDMAVCSFSSPISPPHLIVGLLSAFERQDQSSDSSLQIKDVITIASSHGYFANHLSWEVVSLKPPAGDIAENITYEAVLIKQIATHTGDVKPPLVVIPHGGPHSCYVSGFMAGHVALSLLGFTVLLVNYRGSIGFGQASIDALLGHVGTMDIHDVQEAAKYIIQSGAIDPERVVVDGGSHGGFIAAHLLGQFPDFYKAACVRNPVTDIAAMVAVTDIPDWTYAESGLQYNKWTTLSTASSLTRMLDVSPIKFVDQVKAPVLFLVGARDLRVPPSQSHELYYALKARHIETKMLMYEKSSHPLSEVDVEADSFVNTAVWFYNHLCKAKID